jgi:hypothetical protein
MVIFTGKLGTLVDVLPSQYPVIALAPQISNASQNNKDAQTQGNPARQMCLHCQIYR